MSNRLAILGVLFDAGDLAALSIESLILFGVILAPQMMHVMAWDIARIWTYSILSAFLLLWTHVQIFSERTGGSQFVRLLGIIALFMNAIETTPLMDGLRDHFEVTTRLLLYAPVLAAASGLAWVDRRRPELIASHTAE